VNATTTASLDRTVPPAPRPTASRVFRTALAITLGILTALVIASTLFLLSFGPGERVVTELTEVVEVTNDEVGQAGLVHP
jgi:hypothetical protein